MPRPVGRPRKSPFQPSQMVEPTQSCTVDGADGIPYTFNSKSKPVRGDHPAVVAAPGLFKAVDPEYAHHGDS